MTGPDTAPGPGQRRARPARSRRAALELGLEVTDRLDDVAAVGAELGVVVAYGRIIPAGILDALPMVNLHFSLLPRWRGAAPVERAILAGDAETGVCLMAVEAGPRHRARARTRRVPIGEHEHVSALTPRLATIGAELLVRHPGGRCRTPFPPGRRRTASRPTPRRSAPRSCASTGPDPPSELERVVRLDRAWTTFRHERLRVLDAVASAGPSRRTGPDGAGRGSRHAARAATVRTGDGVLELLDGAAGGEAADVGVGVVPRRAGRRPARHSGATSNAGRLGRGCLRIAPSVLSADFGSLAEAVGEVAPRPTGCTSTSWTATSSPT